MNPWKREWFYYYSYEQYEVNGIIYSRNSTLSFIAYHGIKLIHGEKRLIEMGNYLKKELGL